MSSPSKEMPKQSRRLNILANLDDEIKRLEKLIEEKLVVTIDIHFSYNNDVDIKSIFHHEMLNVFESMESEVDETSKKHEILLNELDRILEANIADDVRNPVMHYYVEVE
ncbi:hypothetical protein Tco_0992342 [Tanacetum coccineum]|uniref:Uncharacterized protein n=1 Tax=Tanacetum coccineum TaxID=301880 RepID=A0ABQ5F2L1_9ASTR